MKKFPIIISLALALFVGVFFFGNSAEASAVSPWNVRITVSRNGQKQTYDLSDNLGGLSAARLQNCGAYASFREKRRIAEELLSYGLPQEAVYEYVLPGFDEFVQSFSHVEQTRTDATVVFGKGGKFVYNEGRDGLAIDKAALFDLALNGCGKSVVQPLPVVVDKAVTVADLKKVTVEKARFTTKFSSANAARRHNVARSASALDGVTVGAGEEFSFNDTVGERSEKNGYQTAKVILDGKYVDGVGGGVCQASTTLYNALLLAEIVPSEAHAHTLVSSYVEVGFDAMVSYGYADLKFTNDGATPLYIAAQTTENSVTFVVYGAPNRFRVVRESVESERKKFAVKEIVDREKYPELVYSDQTKVVTSGSDGVKSKSYLCFYDGNTLVLRKLIRQNIYKQVDMVVARGYERRAVDDANSTQNGN